jgi:hypothetical protein
MTDKHPITPPPDALVRLWCKESNTGEIHFSPQDLATRAARWGADQELEACCMWITREKSVLIAEELGIARRPKPPTLKEQALAVIENSLWVCDHLSSQDEAILRRALEALPE